MNTASIMDGLTLEQVLQAIALIVGALGLAYRVNNSISRPRAALKMDLEILQLLDRLDKEHPRYEAIREDVDRRIDHLFRVPGAGAPPPMPDGSAVGAGEPSRETGEARTEAGTKVRRKRLPWVDDMGPFVFGVVTAVGFTLWTVYLVRHDHSGWAIVTGFFAFGGVGNIMAGVRKSLA
jgi:hypothetical protein